MRIIEVKEDKKAYLDLLLLADEQEDMIDRYLERGRLFTLFDDDLRSLCLVTHEGNRDYEIKNIATYKAYQNRGYGKALIDYVCEKYKGHGDFMYVGTGETPTILRFYENCGFVKSHKIDDFFVEHYDEPIIEEGIQLVDMIYLKRDLRSKGSKGAYYE